MTAIGLTNLILHCPQEMFQPKPLPPPRQRAEYRMELRKARDCLSGVSRENLPEMLSMLTLLANPRAIAIPWLAWRDAILERAMALGYIVGQISELANSQTRWFGVALGTIGSQTIRYSVSGPINHTAPVVGQAVLMTRGYDRRYESGHRVRRYLPVSSWFLHDPVHAA